MSRLIQGTLYKFRENVFEKDVSVLYLSGEDMFLAGPHEEPEDPYPTSTRDLEEDYEFYTDMFCSEAAGET